MFPPYSLEAEFSLEKIRLLISYDSQYDKSFTHGISAATGQPFQEPQETRRMDGNPDVWEGLCGSCNEWVALVSSKKKGTTWFRHAYKVSFISHLNRVRAHAISRVGEFWNTEFLNLIG